MRLTGAAERPQSVRLYLLGEHRMERTDGAAADVPARVDFAGPVDPADLASQGAADLVGDGAYLTVLQHDIEDPSLVADDFRFAPAASDAPTGRWSPCRAPFTSWASPAGRSWSSPPCSPRARRAPPHCCSAAAGAAPRTG
ncbi:DUF2330 domain-containing protein [Nocardiopsis composta]